MSASVLTSSNTVLSNDSAISISDRIDFLSRKKQQRHLTKKEQIELRNLRNAIIPHLLMRSYHLPGYNYWEDLGQYLCNNHPVFGLCFHHKLHPIKFKIRFISLIGSVLFGLAVTNIIFITFALVNAEAYNNSYYNYQFGNFTTGSDAVDQQVAQISVTSGNIALWTIGSATHALYDTLMWEVATCACCMEPGISRKKIERFQGKGYYFVIMLAIFAAAVCAVTIILRETVFDDIGAVTTISNATTGNTTRYLQETTTTTSDGGISWDWSFILSYLVELCLNYFFYYPLIGIIAFTGVLGCCGYIPALGGRPEEVRQMEMDNEMFTSIIESMQTADEENGTKGGLSSKSGHGSNHGIPFSRHAFGRSGSQPAINLSRANSSDNLFGATSSRNLNKGSSHMNLFAKSKSRGNVFGTGSGHGSNGSGNGGRLNFFNRTASTNSPDDFVLDLGGNGRATLTPANDIPKVPKGPKVRKQKSVKKNAMLAGKKGKVAAATDDDNENPNRKMSVVKEVNNTSGDEDDDESGSFAEDSDTEQEIKFEGEETRHRRVMADDKKKSVLDKVSSSLDQIQESVVNKEIS